MLLGMYTIIRSEAERALSSFEIDSIIVIAVFGVGCIEAPDLYTVNHPGIRHIVESSDEVISASLTRQTLDQVFHVETFAGGSHRFTHIERALPLIQAHYQNAQNNYGLE